MKTHKFNLEIEFADDIVIDSQIEDIMANILIALVGEVNSGNGLAPENSDTFTKLIKVNNNTVNSTFKHTF